MPRLDRDILDIAEVTARTRDDVCRRYLWDLRQMRHGPSSLDEFRAAGASLDRGDGLWTGARLAVVATRGDDHELARAFAVFAKNASVAYLPTSDYDEAVRFLCGDA